MYNRLINYTCSYLRKFLYKNKLKHLEKHYGGIIKNVKRNKVSIYDKRTMEQLSTGGMQGGDRMSYHGYASLYAEYLHNIKDNNLVIVEIGILTGIGLAIWCDLFPNAKVIGLDIDLDHFNNNYKNLCQRGAFKQNKPVLFEFDQLSPDIDNNLDIFLSNNMIDILIDDGYHSDYSIINTYNKIKKYLKSNFIYFIEDNISVYKYFHSTNLKVEYKNELTILKLK